MSNEVAIMSSVIQNATLVRKEVPVQDGVVLLCASDLKPEPIRWLWKDWLALGKLHLLAGAPGQGKTTIAVAFAATVSSGGTWPDGSGCRAGNILIWSGEDDPSDTLLPRLVAAGANTDSVHFVDSTRIRGELQSFDPSRDIGALQDKIRLLGNVRLIIVDPIVSAVTGDSHKNTETRRALQPLVDLASKAGAALLGITHFSKGGQGGDPSQRVLGSVAFTAVARVVMVAAKVRSDDGSDRRILARSKSNVGPDDGGYEYRLEQSEAMPGIYASYVAWGAPVSGSARDLLTDPHEDEPEGKSALEGASDFLRQVLDVCPVRTKDIEAQAKAAGISMRTVRRASDALGIIKKRADDHHWYWRLPNSAKLANLSNLSNLESLDTLNNMNTNGEQE